MMAIDMHAEGVEVRLYDIAYNQYVFGLLYKDQVALNKARELAHRISDDVVRAVYENEIPIANTQIVFVGETIALFAFGISWLTKGEAIYGDREEI